MPTGTAAPDVNDFRWVAVTSTVLGPGTYYIGAEYDSHNGQAPVANDDWSVGYLSGITVGTEYPVTYLGNAVSPNQTDNLTFPSQATTDQFAGWFGPNFQFTVAAPPLPTIYGSAFTGTGASFLYSISPSTGAATTIGNIGFSQVGALAFDRRGLLWGIGNNGSSWVLLTINTTTGVGTAVGFLADPTITAITDMDFRPSDGILFALGSAGSVPDTLYAINTITGASTLIGHANSGFTTDGDSLAFNSNSILFNGNQSELDSTNPSNGTRSRAAALTYSPSFGSGETRPDAMKFDPQTGILWASVVNGPSGAATNALGVIDPFSGNVTMVGPTVQGLDGLAIAKTTIVSSLAHAADGNNFKTQLLLTDAGRANAAYSLRFDNDQGNVPTAGFQLQQGSVSGSISAGLDDALITSGQGTQTYDGWGEVTAPPSVGGSVIYSQKTSLPSIQEGTATVEAIPSQHFFVPFDNTNGAVTSMAITNTGTAAASISVTLRYSDGSNTNVLPYPSIGARNHVAFVISTPFPNSAGRAGVAEFTSTAPLIVVVFRFNSTGAFTALDAVPAGTNTSTITRTLAHAADGNNFETTVLLVNTDTNPASYTLRFDDELGNIPASGFQLQQGSLSGTIPPGQSVTIQTAGLGTQTQQGWAELTAPASVGGSVIYSQKTGLPSIQEGTATIVATGSQDFFVPFDNTNGALTSMALINPGTSNSGVINVTLKYTDGLPETIMLAPLLSRNHEAFEFINTFPNSSGRAGVAEFVSNVPLSAVDFRFNSSGAFTALGILPY